MFNVNHGECVGFESRWKVKKVSCVNSTQTTEFQTQEAGTGPSHKVNIETQTETEQRPPAAEAVDEEKLAKWLQGIYPRVKKELDDAVNSRAFRGYRLQHDSSDACLKLLQLLKINDTGVSTMSWNSSGTVLAIATKRDHQNWCYHEGTITFYNLTKEDRLSETPKLKVTTESCVNDIRFHPTSSALIAAGLFSGIIIVWNIHNDEEEILAKVNAQNNGINQLEWISDVGSPKAFLLASSGPDSLLKLWTGVTSTSPFLGIKEVYQIKPPVLGTVPSAAGDEINELDRNVVTIGTLCFGFSKHTPDMFVVGTEGGLIIQCSRLGATKLRSKNPDELLSDPAVKHYVPHKGKVFSVQFSPNRKEMFMTSASDGEVRIYLVDQEEPAQIFFLKDVFNQMMWVPYEEKIIAGCGSSGVIELFHLKSGKPVQNVVRDKVHSAYLNAMEINTTRSNLTAVGDDKGYVQLWKVPWTLLTQLQ